MLLTWVLLLSAPGLSPAVADQSVPAVEKTEPVDRRENARRVRIGMTTADVHGLLGSPKRTARQILYQRYWEQWFYEDPYPLWIEFECRRDREPRVQTVHSSSVANP